MFHTLPHRYIGKRYTQISCFNRETLEPDTIGMGEGTDSFLIPTVFAASLHHLAYLLLQGSY